ncbi:hypothetical protein GCM10012275_12830 [Longimycelium tulufanense]|uniref:Uncharacterized protein n=1 Tax=Longimycelium tulufanense TaxID=907463 RepID=A0A8J3FTR6_9PSEU|nr:hypothetical protein [Longimycelium tulufanense]GGM43306.1 hypothetical protein GCM10012275_12830 [Longimycelium tulufanense]
MITDRDLERIAAAIDDAMRDIAAAQPRSRWEHVEWLRLKADLLDRLAAAQRSWHGSLAHRAELLRDHAERLADQLTGVLPAEVGPEWPAGAVPVQGVASGGSVIPLWNDTTARAADTADQE